METNPLTCIVDQVAEASAGCEEAGRGFLAMAFGCGLRIEVLRNCELSYDIGGEILGVVGHLECDTTFRKGLQMVHEDFYPRDNGTGKGMYVSRLKTWVEALSHYLPGCTLLRD